MVIRLENLKIEGTSLEPTLLDRIRKNLAELKQIANQSEEEVHGWWSILSNNFVPLNQNYQDCMRDLNSLKAEEMMKTRAFLVFKDKLIEYLRGFVKSLQYMVGIIESELVAIREEALEKVFGKILSYELSIPRMEYEVKPEERLEWIMWRFDSIRHWFLGRDGQPAEAETVFDMANDIIRKITRYAAKLSEQSGINAIVKAIMRKLPRFFIAVKI